MKKDKKTTSSTTKASRFSLSAFCDKIIESCWLAALVTAPLFFNFHSGNVFDPDKSNLIHSIAIIMLVAFIIKMLEQPKNTASSPHQQESVLRSRSGVPPLSAGRSHSPDTSVGINSVPTARLPVGQVASGPILKSPLVIIFALLGLSYIFSTIISVTPHMSWWGSYSRAQGTYTLISYFIIFFITLLSLKTPAQINRIIMTAILTSIPICLYGLSQKLKADPLTWDADFSYRIASTLGNPIFLGAYLIMVIPITLALILWSQATSRTYGAAAESRFLLRDAGQSVKRYSGSLSGSEL
ncbi:MAG: hypothetical protein HY762_05625, partial [Planctomycetes bacterium]|nr:hypothetical protein [Planctomycetota bacterium]